MGNAVEFKPERGAFKLAAERLGKHRQQVERAFKQRKNAGIMAAVAKASLDIKERNARAMRQYQDTVNKHTKLAEEVAGMAAQ